MKEVVSKAEKKKSIGIILSVIRREADKAIDEGMEWGSPSHFIAFIAQDLHEFTQLKKPKATAKKKKAPVKRGKK